VPASVGIVEKAVGFSVASFTSGATSFAISRPSHEPLFNSFFRSPRPADSVVPAAVRTSKKIVVLWQSHTVRALQRLISRLCANVGLSARWESDQNRAKMFLEEKNITVPQLTNEIINAAIFGFEEQKRRLDAQIAELRTMLSPGSNGSAGSTSPAEPAVREKQGMSAAGRKAIAEAQRKRSAAVEGQSTEPVAAKRPKRRLVRSERLRTPLSHLAAPLTACCEWL